MLRTIRDTAYVLILNHLTDEAANGQRSQAHSLHCLAIAPFFETTSLHTFLRLRNLALATFWARTLRRTALTRSLYWLLLRVEIATPQLPSQPTPKRLNGIQVWRTRRDVHQADAHLRVERADELGTQERTVQRNLFML